MKKQYDYIIVGAGLFGSVFAYEAKKRGKRCLILDKRDCIGGNIHCDLLDGINVHRYGAHIFHTNEEYIWSYVNQFVKFNNYINSPIANYKGEIYNLPFNMNTFSKMWNIIQPNEAIDIIEKQKKEVQENPENLEDQAISLVGRDIYDKLIKGYTEKQWGRDCRELPAFIIKRIPVRFTYDNNYFNDRYQGIPIEGYNTLIEKLLEGCDIELNVDYNENQRKYNSLAEKIVYTGMIDAYFDYSLGRLQYRSLRFETEKYLYKNHQGVAVVNFTDRDKPYTRMIEHKHFEFGDQPVTYVTKEYPLEWGTGADPFYPINDETNQRLLHEYQMAAQKESNVIFGGRLAEYKYYDMDKVIQSSLIAIQKEFGY